MSYSITYNHPIKFSQESKINLQKILKKINPDIGGFNGYDGPTGNHQTGSDASDKEILPEEIARVLGPV